MLNFLETELVIYPSKKQEKHYDIPDSVEAIGGFAFEDSCLESVSIPDSVETIDIDVFNGCEHLKALFVNIENPMEIQIEEKAFDGFEREKCRLIIPKGCKANYASHKDFKGFLSIREIGSNDENNLEVANGQMEIGQFFTIPPGSILSESKTFCQYKGTSCCYVVMTERGFFLKMLGGAYYFLSENSEENEHCQIWIKDKRGKSSDYDVSYSVNGITGKAFGHFYESKPKGKLMYRDYKTGKSLTIDLRTRKRVD